MALDPDLVCAVSDIGGRWEMEDEYVLEVESTKPLRVVGAVFDGHGGSGVAKLAAARFPMLFRDALPNGPEDAFRAAYASIHREARGLRGGAVAATFYIDGPEVFVANAGDAHIALVTEATATRLTEDHRITNESELRRIVGAGAAIWGPYVSLPSGSGLMATRTLGDYEFESIGVLAEPVTSRHRLEPGFLVAACDGLWDFVATGELPALLKGMSTAEEAAGALAHESLHVRRTSDNLTILVVRIL